eukprot:3793938-Pyramimonas_sp.AAC.1
MRAPEGPVGPVESQIGPNGEGCRSGRGLVKNQRATVDRPTGGPTTRRRKRHGGVGRERSEKGEGERHEEWRRRAKDREKHSVHDEGDCTKKEGILQLR